MSNEATSQDMIREDVLKYLYERYKKSRSVKKQAVSISEIKKALKPKGYKEQDITGAISFLIDRDWLKEIKVKTKFFIKNRLTEGEKITYRISDVGVTHFEGPSKFLSTNRFSGISITNIQGVTVVGNNNIVRNEYLELFRELEELGDQIRSSAQLSDDDKVDLQNDLDTIKSQLGKSKPEKNIIKIAWGNIKDKLGKVPDLAEKITKVIALIKIFSG
ncbi:MAG: hypothetical protein JRI31_12035 [Deltaproteobacteria bacterium]|nr:hypothetical protein [Deltaproteobacteria bacterium]